MANNNNTSFGKIMLASGVGFLIANVVLSFFYLLIVLFLIFSAQKNDSLAENTILEINLNTPIYEQQKQNFDFKFDFFGLSNNKMGLNRIIEVINHAKENDNIKGIFLDLDIVIASLPELEEIHRALVDFKKSGKFVIAHANNYIQTSYYLATAADKIYMTPTGVFFWKGFSTQVVFFKGLLQKLDIEPVVIRHGKFKSAVEPFILDSISPENRQQITVMLQNNWNFYLEQICNARNLKKEDLNLYANKLLIKNSQKAVDYGLVDALKFKQDVIDEIKQILNIDIKNNIPTIDIAEYSKRILDKDTEYHKDKIAIIYAEGQIIEGESQGDNMGSSTIANAIYKAANNENIKAIVLRVNSPGGSALASEIILNEIVKAKKQKPVVVSMGKYAASGGYYISCMADYIYAENYTLTGSIGVFGLLFNFEKLLKNRLGIYIQSVKTNENSDFGSISRKMTATEQEFLQAQIEEIYDIFITHVAQGRNIPKEYVDSIGQGRIWTASDAKKLKLIDEIGSIGNAIDKAAQLAKIDDFGIVEYPKTKSFMDELNELISMRIYAKNLGELQQTYDYIQKLSLLKGPQMLMPYFIEIQ